MTDEAECAFDLIEAGSTAAHIVLDEPGVLGFLDARPVFRGHTLVIPRRHWATIGELPADMIGPLFDAGRRVAAAQRTALGCDGTFVALNDVVSQSVPHVHLHVVPRSRGDGLRGFFWPRTKYQGEADAATVAAGIRAALPGPSPGLTHEGFKRYF